MQQITRPGHSGVRLRPVRLKKFRSDDLTLADLQSEAETLRKKINRFRESLGRFFVDKQEIIDLMVIAAIAQEPLLLVGPPGTAKSDLVLKFKDALGMEEGDYFEYMLTRFTEPSEIIGAIDIKDAVHRDLEASRAVYDFVRDLCIRLGAAPEDLVPFEKYAAAANGLTRPSSAARALNNGAPHIERADKLVQAIAAQKGLRNPVIDATVALVDERLAANRKRAAAA